MTEPHRERSDRRSTLFAMAADATLGLMPPDCRHAGITLRDNGVGWLFYFDEPPALLEVELCEMHEDDPAALAEIFSALAHQAGPGHPAAMRIGYVPRVPRGNR